MAHHSTSAAYDKKIMRPNKAIDISCFIFQWSHASIGSSSSTFQWAQTKLSAAPAGKIMGPCEALDSNSCIYQWAHAKPSATAAAYFNGPMKSQRQKQLHMSMGLYDTIGGSSSSICPWAYTEPSATTVACSNGPKRSYRQHVLGT